MADHPAETPEDIPRLFIEAWNDRDPDAIAALFDEDAEFVNVTGLWWHNRTSIRRAHAYGLERIFNSSTLVPVIVRVKRLADDVAVVHAKMRLSGQTPTGGTDRALIRQNIFSFVVHRLENGTWSCASAHNTDVVPGAETNIIDEEGHFRHVSYRRGKA